MSLPESTLHDRVEKRLDGAREPRAGGPRRSHAAARWAALASIVFALAALQALTARAQGGPQPQASPQPSPQTNPNPCPTPLTPGQNLMKVPELITQGNRLRGTVVLGDQQELMAFRAPQIPPSDNNTIQCFPQYVRIFRGIDTWQYLPNNQGGVSAVPYAPNPTAAGYPLPMPGPTLRARVGDLIQLTFINQINPADFGNSIDRGETGQNGGCDQSSAGPLADKYPDCFHGSSTGNLHFHGTHTNPNTTGDNVFIEVRPSPRDGGKPVVTPESVRKQFEDFFGRCEAQLGGNVLREWPKRWDNLPKPWTDEQERLLRQYDARLMKDYGNVAKQLWPVNAQQLLEGAWPQYYIGAYPYCFRLPEYTAGVWPPPTPTPMQMGGEGTAEMKTTGASADAGEGMAGAMSQDASARPLMMGQAPGTHWYHAHKHGSTAINVANGMTGAFIIEGQYDDDLNTWYGTDWTRTQPLLVINQLGVTPNLLRGPTGRIDKGPDFSVNGQLRPVIEMKAGEVQMWRIVNTSGRAGARFAGPPAGFEWRQLAQDGVQFNDVNYKGHRNKSFLMAAGNRVDLLVKAPDTPCTTAKPEDCPLYPVTVQNEVDPSDLSSANQLTLLSVRITKDRVDPTSHSAAFIPNAPRFPAFLADIADDEVKGTKTLTFSSTSPGQGGMHMIDGKKFDGEVGALVELNHVEEWKINNATFGPQISHPFHIHINPFQITEIFDPNATITVNYTDPKTKKTLTANNVRQYAFVPADLFTILGNPGFQAYVRKQQCQLDPQADPGTWKPCGPPFKNVNNIWWDVFPIPSGRKLPVNKIDPKTGQPVIDPVTKKPVPVAVPGYFKMRSRFVDYPGYYVLHCHILAHEDRGMMTVVEVSPGRTPYSHN